MKRIIIIVIMPHFLSPVITSYKLYSTLHIKPHVCYKNYEKNANNDDNGNDAKTASEANLSRPSSKYLNVILLIYGNAKSGEIPVNSPS